MPGSEPIIGQAQKSVSWVNEANPFLPDVERVLTHQDMEMLGRDRGPAFFEMSLRYAQSLWRTGFPARSLLLCNRALMVHADVSREVLDRLALPYKAVAWLLIHRPSGQFMGNPRYHYQHLASRLSGAHRELQVWRAWACWYLAKELLPEREFPGDLAQIVDEGLVEPTHDDINRGLARLSREHDDLAWNEALRWSQPWRIARPHGRHRVTIRRLDRTELPVVRQLAERIWPRVYPDIISGAQIGYMLDRFYDVAVMWDEMERRGVCYAIIEVDGCAAGYLSFEILRQDRAAFLHKLYLMPECHGIGAGAMALDWVEQCASKLGMRQVRLRVNKGNRPAIRAYLRGGFEFAGAVVTDIGGGFVMDDYWMVKSLR